jgi:energy-converting hydrogenase Eha subunit A
MSSSCQHHQAIESTFHWHDRAVWQKSAYNTAWCLLGCSIGDFGTIAWFQFYSPETNPLIVMSLAIINGIITSIILETIILHRQMPWAMAFKTAIGMSMISMVAMELSMNITDYLLVGGARLTWWVIPIMLTVGFLTPWPYNYWRLKKLGKACH